MSAAQKHAWYNLIVIGVTLAAVVGLYPLIGWKANGALALSGLLGFGPLFFRKRKGEVVMDERDHRIQKHSALLGYAVFWVVFCLAASLLSPAVYGQDGSIPVVVIQLGVFYAMILFVGVMSLATLAQYSRG